MHANPRPLQRERERERERDAQRICAVILLLQRHRENINEEGGKQAGREGGRQAGMPAGRCKPMPACCGKKERMRVKVGY
jgi:hypothetical protein